MIAQGIAVDEMAVELVRLGKFQPVVKGFSLLFIIGEIGHTDTPHPHAATGPVLQIRPTLLGFECDGNFRWIAPLYPNPAPVAGRLLCSDPALFQQHHTQTLLPQK